MVRSSECALRIAPEHHDTETVVKVLALTDEQEAPSGTMITASSVLRPRPSPLASAPYHAPPPIPDDYGHVSPDHHEGAFF